MQVSEADHPFSLNDLHVKELLGGGGKVGELKDDFFLRYSQRGNKMEYHLLGTMLFSR